MASKAFLFSCVAFTLVCCAAALDINNGTCDQLQQEDCCNETMSQECGWCKVEGVQVDGCYNLTETNCTNENTCKRTVTCDGLNLVDCCGTDTCGWCGNATTNVSSCSTLTNGSCPLDVANECPTESTCTKADNVTQCCGLGCGWCGKDGKFSCHFSTNASCLSPGDENQCPTESTCSKAGSITQCCGLDCGWCNKDGKFSYEPEGLPCCEVSCAQDCHTLFDETCKAVDANHCTAGNTTDTCKADNSSVCCEQKGCGWCGSGDTIGCFNATSTNCTGEGIVNSCVGTCENMTELQCCGHSDICGWCGETEQNCYNRTGTECTKEGAKNLCLTTTPAPTTTTTAATTTAATTTTTAAPTAAPVGQHFDAASFIGGIALTVGIFGIAVFGYKYYSAKKDANYHTL